MKSLKYIPYILLFLFTSCNLYTWGPGSNYNKIYDVNTVETITGQVTKIDKIFPDKNMSYGIHMTLNTGSGEVSVHLGPGWFIENQDIQIKADDKVTVTGSKLTYEGSDAIIAREVIKRDQVLKLRDDNGFPLWSGWRNRN